MLITWHGQGAVQLKLKDATVLIDPYNKDSGLVAMRKPFNAILLAHGAKDRDNIKSIKEPGVVIESAGEYEVGEIGIEGHESNFEKPEDSKQVIYTIHAEDLNICHLADLDHELSDKQIDAIGDVDILFIPVGGKDMLDGDKAAAVVSEIEPRMVVPIYYKIPGVKDAIADEKKFLKALGGPTRTESSLSLKKSALPAGDMEIVVLQKS